MYVLSYIFRLQAAILFIAAYSLGCKKFVSIQAPNTQLVTASVFANDATATAAMTGVYGNMYGNYGFAGQTLKSISLLAGLSADEFVNYSTDAAQTEFFTNELSKSNSDIDLYLWGQPYQDIYDANAIIEGLNSSKTISAEVKQELSGEAKFLRAFCYFYLVNSFGAVPLITSTNYTLNASSVRSPSSQVFKQIITDCKDAQGLLAADYSSFAGERTRPVKAVATALLARTYLYNQNWPEAEIQSSAIIENTSTYSIVNLDSVFFKNSQEAIWQFQPVTSGQNTNEGNYFILLDPPTSVTLSNQLLNAFEIGDMRRTKWIDSLSNNITPFYYPYKYKVKASFTLSEYSMVFRLAEQYLIRAEARAEQGNIQGAQDDLNIIRMRAGLPPTSANTTISLITAIMHERQTELFSEWGHRWFDLKRTGLIDSVMNQTAPLKGGSWITTQQLYPIPQSERNNNPNLSQNPGY